MRLAWFKKLKPTIQILVLAGLLFVLVGLYIPLSKFLKASVVSLLLTPLKLGEGISSNARQFLRFQDLAAENKRLDAEVDRLNAQLVQLQEAQLENQRLRELLSLPQLRPLKTQTALLLGKDSSNWTKSVFINKGALNGVKEGQPAVLGSALVGKVIEVAPNAAKVLLVVDFNSKIPAKILSTREDGVVFGARQGWRNVCKIKYIQEVKIGDKIISSGLGETYPKGLLIGEVVAVQEEKNRLYKIAEIQPAVDFSTLEEVMIITGQ